VFSTTNHNHGPRILRFEVLNAAGQPHADIELGAERMRSSAVSRSDDGSGGEHRGDRKPSLPCPPRALCGGHLWSFAANHGQPKPLLNGSGLPESSCSQALDGGSIPLTRSTTKAQVSVYLLPTWAFVFSMVISPSCHSRATNLTENSASGAHRPGH
jgi:hypothetical protein